MSINPLKQAEECGAIRIKTEEGVEKYIFTPSQLILMARRSRIDLRLQFKRELSKIRKELVRLGVLEEEIGTLEHLDIDGRNVIKDKLTLLGELALLDKETIIINKKKNE